VVKGVADLAPALDAIKAEAAKADWKVVNVENRFTSDGGHVNTGPTAFGYRDVSMHLVSPDGLHTELQVNTVPIQAAKDGQAHALYESIRPMLEQAATDGVPLTSVQRAKAEKVKGDSLTLYKAALDASTRGSAKRPRSGWAAGPAVHFSQRSAASGVITLPASST